MKAIAQKEPYNADLDLDFFAHPTTKDVQKKIGNESIKRSVRNLVFSNYYERPFRSNVGSNIRSLLFENITPFTEIMIQNAVTEVLQKFEPRIFVTEVIVNVDPDNNGFDVTIQYVILERNIPATVSVFLERIR